MVRSKTRPKSRFSGDITLGRTRRRSSKVSPSYGVLAPHQINEQYYLGNVPLGTTNNLLPDSWAECKVHFSHIHGHGSSDFILTMLFDVDNILLINIGDNDAHIKDIFTSKLFAFRFYIDSEIVVAQLYLRHLPLVKFNASIGNVLKMVFASLLKTELASGTGDISQSDTIEPQSLVEFYKMIKEVRDRNFPKLDDTLDVQHPSLKPILRPYQQDAVRWMLSRESFRKSKEMLHPLFQEITLDTGTILYFNKYTGYVDNLKPVVSSLGTGGILADEMGLGKTVEVLACILLSPKPSNNCSDSSFDAQSPPVLIKSKKRKIEAVIDPEYHCTIKRVKISDAWVKNSSKKSVTRQCLELWYNSKLEDVVGRKSKSKELQQEVYCICGNNNMTKDAVQCVDCLKYQHGSCLGYKNKFGDYRCPNCWIEQPLLESKATLIVCPVSLRTQWCEEICKHVSSGLRIFVYEGSKATPVYPIELSDFDVVITTYSVLQSELRLTESTTVPSLRHARRYAAQGSPLSRVSWWRLCLDEAQMVEFPTSMMSTMAKKLNAQHRWAVTGTPITRDVSGLYGLIDYLQLEPFNQLEAWKYMLYLPYTHGQMEPMFNFLAQVMWRWSKEEVIDQIGIPSQAVIEYPLEFSAVENFFYRKEHNISAKDFQSNIKKAQINKNVALRSVDRSTFNFVMMPLLSIRQACNSANTVRGRYLVTRRQGASIKDLLDALITKNLNFCEENLRMLVAALNGLAGINLLCNDQGKAVAEYRKVLRLAAQYNAQDTKKGLAVDKLQLIHTMYNLAEVLQTAPPVEPTLHDHTLHEDRIRLQEKYMEKYINECLATFEESEAATSTVKKLEEKFIFPHGQWYSDLIEWISTYNQFGDIAQRISNAAGNANIEKLSSFSDERDLLYLITVWDEDITKLRLKSYKLLSEMYAYDNGKLNISDQLVHSAMECHLRPVKKLNTSKAKCLVCKVSRHMRKYEAKLFEMTQNDTNAEDISNKGSWKPSWAELVFRALFIWAKSKNVNEYIICDGEIYINFLDALKREFKQKRKFWTYLHQQINALDEINMCKIRINFKGPADNKRKTTRTDIVLKQLSTVLNNATEFINYIEPHELELHETILRDEEIRNTLELEKNLGTSKYLETLRCQQYAGQNPDPCPICKNEFQDHWSILPCGHSYCLECMDTLIKKSFVNLKVTCSICRQTNRVLDISYIRTKDATDTSVDAFRIKGDYSTKIEAIVKLIVRLKNDDNHVKILVFSTWIATLAIIDNALKFNDISTEAMFANTLKKSVENFKTPSKNVTALLLPIHLGGKGLNLIEATHVILVEPLLHPGDELQAVGRVHRIGQTKPTTVHKFIVQNTIEENIHKAITANAVTWDANRYTLGQLIDLFVTNEDSPIQVDEAEIL